MGDDLVSISTKATAASDLRTVEVVIGTFLRMVGSARLFSIVE
jgi:hypothetical protein